MCFLSWFDALEISALWSFIFSFLSMIPIAALLGWHLFQFTPNSLHRLISRDLTEKVAEFTTEVIGGFLLATFGNAYRYFQTIHVFLVICFSPELIISIFALKNNLRRICLVSLLGSVLSNSLLVLGNGISICVTLKYNLNAELLFEDVVCNQFFHEFFRVVQPGSFFFT